jgi:hypothetical protein
MMFAVLAIASIAFGADNRLGTWKLNTAKSKQAPGGSPITNFTETIEAADGGEKITAKVERADGSKNDLVETAPFGKEIPMPAGARWDTVEEKQVDANTFTLERRSRKAGKYHSTVRIVVSKDGKSMTYTENGTDADGKLFTSVLVFDRQ